MVIAYSYKPSHGHTTKLICPDTRNDIYNICKEVLGDKLIWDENQEYPSEGHHRGVRYLYSPGYDVILTVDADEIMMGIPNAVETFVKGGARYGGINGYINLFRSFSWACYDGFRPIRLENLRVKNTLQDLEVPMTIYHFSLCQRREVMEYKYQSFGHASEIKKNYMEEVFYKWSPENNIPDLHPVSIGLWNATPFDKTKMPDFLKQHPNYLLDIIP